MEMGTPGAVLSLITALNVLMIAAAPSLSPSSSFSSFGERLLRIQLFYILMSKVYFKNIIRDPRGEDGGRVRRRDHLPPHRYTMNTSTRGTTPTEHLLKASKPQTSQKARKSPRTWVGQKKKE